MLQLFISLELEILLNPKLVPFLWCSQIEPFAHFTMHHLCNFIMCPYNTCEAICCTLKWNVKWTHFCHHTHNILLTIYCFPEVPCPWGDFHWVDIFFLFLFLINPLEIPSQFSNRLPVGEELYTMVCLSSILLQPFTFNLILFLTYFPCFHSLLLLQILPRYLLHVFNVEHW